MTRSIKASHYRENLFPHSELSKIVGKPTYSDILTLRREVSANLASVPSTLGGGQFGHIGLALSDSAYKRLCSATVAYVRPTDPGKFIPGEFTGTELVHAKQDHEDLIYDFLEVNVLERTIINQLQSALERSILLPKTNKISGLITCTIPEIFKYLFRAYGNITAISLADARYNVIKHQYVHTDPIETVFDKIQDYANMAEAYGNPEPEVQLIEMGLIIIMHAVIFADDIGTWNKKSSSSNTWESFQEHFITAQTTYKANRPTEISASLGFSTEQANAVMPSQTEQDLDAANAYIADLEATVASTQQANQVSLPSTTSSETLQLLLTKFKELDSEVKATKNNSNTGSGSDGNKKKKNKQKDKKDRKYCWTHGSCAHDGKECNNPNDGHKKEATFANMLGGSTKDCYWLQNTSA